jgi:hypothetical protein
MAVSPMEEMEKEAAIRINAVLSHVQKDHEDLNENLAQNPASGVEGLSAVREVLEALRRLDSRLKCR